MGNTFNKAYIKVYFCQSNRNMENQSETCTMLNSYNLFPLLPLHTMENCTPFIRRLLKYPAIAKECAITR
jgi:hypothetical protein